MYLNADFSENEVGKTLALILQQSLYFVSAANTKSITPYDYTKLQTEGNDRCSK